MQRPGAGVHEELLVLSNLLVFSLSLHARESLLAWCTPVALPLRMPLYKSEVVPQFAYFMTSGMASIMANMPNGATTEVEIICREGLIGSLHLLGDAPVRTDCFMRIEGIALRIDFQKLKQFFRESEEIRTLILQYTQRQVLGASQMVGCNRLHSAEQRLSFWLLIASGRTSSSVINVTQESLSEALGVRRTTVTAIAVALQKQNLITYARGRINIVDRSGLEAASCCCYEVVRSIASDPLRNPETGLDSAVRHPLVPLDPAAYG